MIYTKCECGGSFYRKFFTVDYCPCCEKTYDFTNPPVDSGEKEAGG
jgi:hypothetical protein